MSSQEDSVGLNGIAWTDSVIKCWVNQNGYIYLGHRKLVVEHNNFGGFCETIRLNIVTT